MQGGKEGVNGRSKVRSRPRHIGFSWGVFERTGQVLSSCFTAVHFSVKKQSKQWANEVHFHRRSEVEVQVEPKACGKRQIIG